MKKIPLKFSKSALLLIHLSTAASLLEAQVYPLSENTWENPEFVKRFLGSYGIDSQVEPKISDEELVILQSVAEYASQDKMDDAIDVLKENLDFESSSAALDYTLGNLLFQSEKVSAAIEQYTNAIRKFPRFRRAYKNLGLVQVQEGRYSDAATLLVKTIELGAEGDDVYGLLGYCYLNLERYSSALDAYSRALLFKPESKDWKQGKAQCLFAMEAYSSAISLFDELILDKPDRPEYWLLQANAYMATDKTSEAASNLEVVRRMNKAGPETLLLLGDLHMSQDAPELAASIYKEALKADKAPKFKQGLRAGQILASYARWKEASDYLSILKPLYKDGLSDTNQTELLNLEAQVKMGLGDKEQAARILEQVIIKDPLNGRALLQLGQFHSEKDEGAKASIYYEDAARVEKYRVEALTLHAQLLVRAKDYSSALNKLEEAQRLKPRESVGRYLDEVRKAAEFKAASKD